MVNVCVPNSDSHVSVTGLYAVTASLPVAGDVLRFPIFKCWAACIGNGRDNKTVFERRWECCVVYLEVLCVDWVYSRSEAVSHLIDSTSLYASCLGLNRRMWGGNLRL